MKPRRGYLLALLVGLSMPGSPVLTAQSAPAPRPPDPPPARVLDPVVVVTEARVSAALVFSVSAVTRLSAAELARLPRATLADVLRLAPGFSVISFDGLGFDPQLMVRGFYGGGEAEYVVVLVNGRPVNQLQSGLVAWDVLPALGSIEAIEVVRGAASSLYGDAAIGGVINVITRSASRLDAELSAGSFGGFRGSAEVTLPSGWKHAGLTVELDRTGGFREHAKRTSARTQIRVPLLNGSGGRIAVTLRSHWREFDEPGPLLESLHAERRSGSDTLFRFDHTRDRSYGVLLDGDRRLGGETRLRVAAEGELRESRSIRTLALAPGFGDTKQRHAATSKAATSLQLETGGTRFTRADRLVLGLEASRGALDSRYYRYAGGTRDDYAAAPGERGALDTRGNSVRTAAAVYAQYLGQPFDALRLSLGMRVDGLRDHFDPSVPAGEAPQAASHSALSPKLGVNLRYWNGAANTGNVFAALSRSFKAPTLDQLYDQRNIPIPFPPFEVRTSNPELQPQRGTSFEVGGYHNAVLSGALRAAASISVYHTEMRDELDFDVASFRYVNIGSSRHRGVEAGANLEAESGSAFVAYTLQAAVSRSGANAGKRLKAIPRHALNAGLSFHPPWHSRLLQTTLAATHVRDSYLDDANTVSLPNYTRVDGQLALRAAALTLFLDVRNLLDARYSASAFLDPSGSGEAYLYPAAGRVIELGLRGSWVDPDKTMKRVMWSAANVVMGLAFVFSVVVQVNDPDPLLWMLLYGAAALVCGLAVRGRAGAGFPAIVSVIALGWAASIAPRVIGVVPFEAMFAEFEMQNAGVEEAREMYGLLLVAAWLATVALVERSRRGGRR